MIVSISLLLAGITLYNIHQSKNYIPLYLIIYSVPLVITIGLFKLVKISHFGNITKIVLCIMLFLIVSVYLTFLFWHPVYDLIYPRYHQYPYVY